MDNKLNDSWHNEFKKFFIKKFKGMMGEDFDISPDNITIIEIPMDIDVSQLSLKELTSIYAHAIMKEDYEGAEGIKKEIIKRGYEIKIEAGENKNEAVLRTFNPEKPDMEEITIDMKVNKDTLMIDFEKEIG
jgi:hypothetical protein